MKKITILTLFLVGLFCTTYPKNGMIKFSLDKKTTVNTTAKKSLSVEALQCCEKGEKEFEKKNYDKALEYFQSANKIDPKNAYFEAMIGWVKEKLGDLDGAIIAYDNAIALNVTNVSILLNKAIVKWNLKLFNDAYESVNIALLIDSNYYDAYILKSDFLFRQNKYSESYTNLNRAIQINSTLEEGFYKRGLTLVFMGEYKNAIPDLSKSIALNKDSSENYYYRAYAYKMIGDTLNAMNDYKQGIKIKRSAKLYYDRALIYIQKDKLYKAISDLENAEKFDPSDMDVIRKLGKLYFDIERFEDAKSYSEKAYKANNRDAEMRNVFVNSCLKIIQQKINNLNLKYR